MSLLSRLFGGGGAAKSSEAEPVSYEGFTIYPAPMREGSKWRVAARIEKTINDDLKTHQLIRADTLEAEDMAIEASVNKAKQMINEQGEGIFG